MGHRERAERHVAQLDAARTQGTWNEVPELVKKLKKSAPQRKVLASTAMAEYFIATNNSSETASATKDNTLLSELRDVLQSTTEEDEQDVLQGRTCLLWARWLSLIHDSQPIPEGGLVKDMQVVKEKDTSTYTKICMIKSAYFQGMTCQRNRQTYEAKTLFTFAVDLIQSSRDLIASTPQLAYWSEQLLAQLVLISPEDDSISPEATNALRLQVFRHWVHVVSWEPETSATTYRNTSDHLSRIVIWRKYYEHLSLLLREDSKHHDRASPDARLQLATEIRKVEGLYESELLRTHKFPKASESNAAIEEWVEQVIGNWRLFCSPHWRENEVGEGGRNAITHTVLDILYRAATKTFHSTLILRRLFQVHKSLTEFDLAYRSLDTYIELAERAKARAAKTTTPVTGVETTETLLVTIAEGIEGLCSFGGQAEARKAHDLCVKVISWLRKIGVHDDVDVHINGSVNGSHLETVPRTVVSSESLENIWRALGVGKAYWSRWTPFTEQRTQLQEDSVGFLNKACSQKPANELQLETHYAIALVLAETRQIEEAISHVKSGLNVAALASSDGYSWTAERRSVSLWHLLALLLSSRQEFDVASKSCHAAFQQLPSSTILMGSGDRASSFIAEKSRIAWEEGLLQDMETREIHKLVEIRITELALTELKNGPEDAVNASNELLSIFSHFFAHLDLEASISKLAPAKTPAETLKSVKGSIFGRKKHRESKVSIIGPNHGAPSMMSEKTRPSTQATEAPTIQVTDEYGKSPHGKKHRIRDSLERKHVSKPAIEAPKKLIRKSSQRSALATSQTNLAIEGSPARGHDLSQEAKQPLPKVPHNLDSHSSIPPPVSHPEQPPHQDVRLPTLHPLTSATSPPAPRFSKAAAQTHALGILVKIWLIIATLYRRASMFEDSREAWEEANKSTSKIEELVGTMDHSARAFAKAGWGGMGKSVDEIWADVHFEHAELLLAIYRRIQTDGHIVSNDDLRKAVEHYEQSLLLAPDHPGASVGLSNLLLDYYEKKCDLSRHMDDGRPKGMGHMVVDPSSAAHANNAAANGSVLSVSLDSPNLDGIPGSFEIPPPLANGNLRSAQASARPSVSAVDDLRARADNSLKKTPENLIRIAARDRAYGLLSNLTKLGAGWDNSEAWDALARAHELSGETDKAKQALWWCVELEDTRPIRHWRNLGYTLD